MSEGKKIIIDEDWKSQVEAEKAAAHQTDNEPRPSGSDQPDSPADPVATTEEVTEQPAEVEGSPADANPPADPPMPPASMGMLMSSLATEALISMGQMPHPATGEVMKARNQAKYLIDMLDVLKTKTAGNLTGDEAQALDDILHQLRMAFVASK